MALDDCYPQFVCASVTISDPIVHLDKLFGLPFEVIGPEFDTSPKHEVNIVMLVQCQLLNFG